MIDEGVLSDALQGVANSFEISKDATDRILSEARAEVADTRSLRAPGFLVTPGRGRKFLIAAVLILVAGGISLPLFRGEGTPNLHDTPYLGAAPSTTVPGHFSQEFGPATDQTTVGSPTLSATGSTVTETRTGIKSAATSSSLKIESNGSVDLTVPKGKIELTLSKLGALVSGDGGYVDSTQANVGARGPGSFSYATTVLEVPQRTFATLVAQVQHVGRTTSLSTNSANVTAQYVDLKARITALEASRQQYLVIMSRATSISDILAVQSQLNDLQSQIEQYQGQLNVLNHQTTYGALTVMLTEAGHSSNTNHPRSGIAKAWHDAVAGFVAGFEWLIRISGPALFALLLLAALWIAGRFGRRAYQRRRL
jgi:hypothetical protein